MPTLAKPWSKYSISHHSTQTFTELFHVTHLDIGYRILDECIIRPALIGDESKLNTERILVNWLSPNEWFPGYRYGNIRFRYDFQQLMEGKKMYWVEAMTSYNPTALRLLLSKKDYTDYELIEYRPRIDDGPLRYKNKEWLMDSRFTYEIMVDEPLYISECKSIDFVKHHEHMCCIGSACPDSHPSQKRAAIRFLGLLISRSKTLYTRYFLKTSNGKKNTGEFTEAIQTILNWTDKLQFRRTFRSLSHEQKLTVLEPFFTYIGDGQLQKFKDCITLLNSKEEFQELFFQLLQQKLGIKDFTALEY